MAILLWSLLLCLHSDYVLTSQLTQPCLPTASPYNCATYGFPANFNFLRWNNQIHPMNHFRIWIYCAPLKQRIWPKCAPSNFWDLNQINLIYALLSRVRAFWGALLAKTLWQGALKDFNWLGLWDQTDIRKITYLQLFGLKFRFMRMF